MWSLLITSRNPFFKGKLPTCQLMYGWCVVCLGGGGTLADPSGGVPWLVHLGGYPGWSIQGGPLPCSLLGGYPGWSIWGVPWLVHPEGGGGPLPCSVLGGVHFHVHFWGNPMWPIGRSKGCCQCVPPLGSRFFPFDIQILRNIAALGVGAPLQG